MSREFIDKQKLAEQFAKETGFSSGQVGVGYIDDLIDKQPVAFDMDRVIDQIRLYAAIYNAEDRLQNFGMVSNSYIRAYDADTNEELFKYELDEDFSLETGIVAGELYRKNGEWKFNAIGCGYNDGFVAIAKNFGLNV